jgi:general secretion pathway protein I
MTAREAGFTLVETLVALAVLAATSVALLGATQAHVARIAGLEVRAAAQWVAENRLAERRLGLTPADPPAPMLGHAFAVTETRTPTADPALLRLDIAVAEAGSGAPRFRLTGFVVAEGGP